MKPEKHFILKRKAPGSLPREVLMLLLCQVMVACTTATRSVPVTARPSPTAGMPASQPAPTTTPAVTPRTPTPAIPTAVDAPTPTPHLVARGALLASRDLSRVSTDLYLVNTNAGGLVRVTTGAAVDTVAWSSDGKKLVFSAATTMPGRYGLDLYTVNSDGSGLTRIPAARDGQAEPAWSPDGSQIVYTQGFQTLHIMNVDGSAAHYLTDGQAASWSPDGQSIVFVRRLPHDLYGDIYVIGADGRDERRLTQGFHADRPVWSPDGQRIAFYGYLTNWSGGGVYIMNADGSGLSRASKRLGVPAWFPDGQHIIQGLYDTIFIIDIGAGTARTLLTPSSLQATYFTWQPGSD